MVKLKQNILKLKLQEAKLESEIILQSTTRGDASDSGASADGTGEETPETVGEIGEFLAEEED